MTMELIHSLTEIITEDISLGGGIRRPVRRADNLTNLHVPIV